MAWKLEGTFLENCNCEAACPCTGLGRKADYDRCVAFLAFHVDRGEIEGTDVSGRTVAWLFDTPPVMSAGNWRAGVLIDDQASPDQVEKLGAVMRGQKGGQPAFFAESVGEFLGIQQIPMKYSNHGNLHAVTMGSRIDVEVADVVDDETNVPLQLVGVGHPANSTLNIAVSTRGRIRAFGIEVDNADKSAFSAPFSWAG